MNISKNNYNQTAFAKLFGILAVGLVLLLVISGCSGSGSSDSTIDLMEYVSVAISGDDGYGKASYSFDYGTFEAVLAEKLDADKDSAQFFADATIIEEGIKISLDKALELSNGDSVILTVDYNDEAAKDYKISFQGGTATYTATYNVTDLTEVAEFTADDNEVIVLLSETTVLHYAQNIPVAPDKIRGFIITDTQVDYQRNSAQVDYAYDLDCAIAVLSVTGSVQYKYENDAWESTNFTHLSEIKEYTLTGVYEGKEWGIADDGASCNARYEISETADGEYKAVVTWSANDESPNIAEHTVTISLLNSFETARFAITNINSEIKTADGKSPYFSRALKFDFINGGFTTDGEVSLLKISD